MASFSSSRKEAGGLMKQKAGQKHILVAVLGQTPQIVTETLYALMVKRRPLVPITSVYIVTTSKGAEVAWRALGGPQGQIARLLNEYGFPPRSVSFERDHIVVLRREDGRRGEPAELIDDIRTSGDNRLLASQLVGFIKDLTEEQDTVLYCSVAGGRKTMSAYMLLAMTLYGREADRLTHILVSGDFESNPKFFFPPKRNKLLPVRSAETGELIIVETKDANVELAEIPFVRLRPLLGPKFKSLERGVEELIHIAQTKIELSETPPEGIVLNLTQREARFGNLKVELTGVKLALLAYYADTKANHCVEPERPFCAECRACFQRAPDIDLNRFLELYRAFFTQSNSQFEVASAKLRVGKSLDADTVMTYNNRINEVTKKLSPLVRIISERSYGNTRYGLSLDKTLIQITR